MDSIYIKEEDIGDSDIDVLADTSMRSDDPMELSRFTADNSSFDDDSKANIDRLKEELEESLNNQEERDTSWEQSTSSRPKEKKKERSKKEIEEEEREKMQLRNFVVMATPRANKERLHSYYTRASAGTEEWWKQTTAVLNTLAHLLKDTTAEGTKDVLAEAITTITNSMVRQVNSPAFRLPESDSIEPLWVERLDRLETAVQQQLKVMGEMGHMLWEESDPATPTEQFGDNTLHEDRVSAERCSPPREPVMEIVASTRIASRSPSTSSTESRGSTPLEPRPEGAETPGDGPPPPPDSSTSRRSEEVPDAALSQSGTTTGTLQHRYTPTRGLKPGTVTGIAMPTSKTRTVPSSSRHRKNPAKSRKPRCPVCKKHTQISGWRCVNCKAFWNRLVRRWKTTPNPASRPQPCNRPEHATAKPPSCSGCRWFRYEAAFLDKFPAKWLPIPPLQPQTAKDTNEGVGFQKGEVCGEYHKEARKEETKKGRKERENAEGEEAGKVAGKGGKRL